MSKAARDAIRSRVFSEKRKVQLVALDDGVQIEVRQTSVGEMLDTVAVEDNKQRLVRLLIAACYVPGTEEKVFEDTDAELIMSMPSGGYYQRLLDAINKDTLDKQAEQAKKTSGEVTSSTSST